MANFNFNIIEEILNIVEIGEEDKKAILDDYTSLLKLKAVEIADFKEEELKDLDFAKDGADVLSKLLEEKYKSNPQMREEFDNYILYLNGEFIATISKRASDEQKKKMLEYIDRHEAEMKKLIEQNQE